MALSQVELGFPEQSRGRLKEVYRDVDGLASYTTGGQEITARSLGLSRILFAIAMSGDSAAHTVQARKASKKSVTSIKLIWLLTSDGAEVAAAVDLSGRFTTICVIGY